MKTQQALILIRMLLLSLAPVAVLAGCGGDDYQSEKEFLDKVREEAGSKGEAEGTMPPVGEPMKIGVIRMETTELDLGKVPNDMIHHHKLKVYNDGQMPLKITKIDTTCACTMGNVTPENATIPPGRESWIDVTLDPERVPGFKSHKILTITSTDPNQPQVEVNVYAEIEPEYFLETEELQLGEFPKGDVVERRVRFRQIQDSPANVTGVEVLSLGPKAPKIAGMNAHVEAIPEAQWQTPGKREYDIVIATGPEISSGAFERNVILLTDVKRLPKHRIHVLGTALTPYTPAPIYPERITLAPTPQGDVTARATFTSTAPLALTILNTSNPVLTATVVPGLTPNEFSVEARIAAANVPKQIFDETVSVQITAEGKTYTEIIGVTNANNAAASEDGHAPGDGHNH